jgi:hypothetical protein
LRDWSENLSFTWWRTLFFLAFRSFCFVFFQLCSLVRPVSFILASSAAWLLRFKITLNRSLLNYVLFHIQVIFCEQMILV